MNLNLCTKRPHLWVSNSGRGGDPEYQVSSQFGPRPVMHVRCDRCGNRTWFNEMQWELLHEFNEATNATPTTDAKS